ncbi:MAG: hypothetical protein ACE15B_15210 [Bryobacteraceae bacterium]
MRGNAAQDRLAELRNGLMRVHKALVESERSVYERDVARIASPGQMLNLLLNAPWFVWLRQLSELVVLIDEALSDHENPAGGPDAERFLAQARGLLTPAEYGDGFNRRYFEALQRDPDVVLAHGAMMRLLANLEG